MADLCPTSGEFNLWAQQVFCGCRGSCGEQQSLKGLLHPARHSLVWTLPFKHSTIGRDSQNDGVGFGLNI